jgi:hypothetical protein
MIDQILILNQTATKCTSSMIKLPADRTMAGLQSVGPSKHFMIWFNNIVHKAIYNKANKANKAGS